MIIHVTQKDIDSGNASLDACPITIALRRQLKNNKITVSRDFIRIPKRKPRGHWKLVKLPTYAKEFLLNYYSYYPNQPFDFFLPKKDANALKG